MQEMCILVDDNDKIIGAESKKNCKPKIIKKNNNNNNFIF